MDISVHTGINQSRALRINQSTNQPINHNVTQASGCVPRWGTGEQNAPINCSYHLMSAVEYHGDAYHAYDAYDAYYAYRAYYWTHE